MWRYWPTTFLFCWARMVGYRGDRVKSVPTACRHAPFCLPGQPDKPLGIAQAGSMARMEPSVPADGLQSEPVAHSFSMSSLTKPESRPALCGQSKQRERQPAWRRRAVAATMRYPVGLALGLGRACAVGALIEREREPSAVSGRGQCETPNAHYCG